MTVQIQQRSRSGLRPRGCLVYTALRIQARCRTAAGLRKFIIGVCFAGNGFSLILPNSLRTTLSGFDFKINNPVPQDRRIFFVVFGADSTPEFSRVYLLYSRTDPVAAERPQPPTDLTLQQRSRFSAWCWDNRVFFEALIALLNQQPPAPLPTRQPLPPRPQPPRSQKFTGVTVPVAGNYTPSAKLNPFAFHSQAAPVPTSAPLATDTDQDTAQATASLFELSAESNFGDISILDEFFTPVTYDLASTLL